jgi:ATP-dependent Clp protease ATP-binding subunit ClpB
MGADVILERLENEKSISTKLIESTKIEVLQALKQRVRPEFINRIDDIIMFLPLTPLEIKEIVAIQLRSISKLLAQQGITIDATPAAINLLAKMGYEPQYGARPVKRVMQKELLNTLSRKLLSQEIQQDSIILIDAVNEELVFKSHFE